MSLAVDADSESVGWAMVFLLSIVAAIVVLIVFGYRAQRDGQVSRWTVIIVVTALASTAWVAAAGLVGIWDEVDMDGPGGMGVFAFPTALVGALAARIRGSEAE